VVGHHRIGIHLWSHCGFPPVICSFCFLFSYQNYFRHCFLPVFVLLFCLQESSPPCLSMRKFYYFKYKLFKFYCQQYLIVVQRCFHRFPFFLLNFYSSLSLFQKQHPSAALPGAASPPSRRKGREQKPRAEPSPAQPARRPVPSCQRPSQRMKKMRVSKQQGVKKLPRTV
jgi:hypothetical protein